MKAHVRRVLIQYRVEGVLTVTVPDHHMSSVGALLKAQRCCDEGCAW